MQALKWRFLQSLKRRVFPTRSRRFAPRRLLVHDEAASANDCVRIGAHADRRLSTAYFLRGLHILVFAVPNLHHLQSAGLHTFCTPPNSPALELRVRSRTFGNAIS